MGPTPTYKQPTTFIAATVMVLVVGDACGLAITPWFDATAVITTVYKVTCSFVELILSHTYERRINQ